MQIKTTLFKRALVTVFVLTIYPATILFAQPVPALAANQLVLPSKAYTVPFSWQGDSILSGWEPNAAMLIPVKLKNCPRLFYMQFDLGSPYSLLYKNKMDAIQEKYPGSVPLKEDGGKLPDFSFKAGKMPVLAKEIIVKQFDSTTINWKNKNGIEIIGTIGADLIDGKTVIIDYPHRKLTIAQNIPGKLRQRISLTSFIYTGRRVLLPAKLKGKETILYFDTGSSMFELLTDKETCKQLAAPGATLVTFPVRSWNKVLTANTLASNESISLANTVIPVRSSTYIEGVSNAQVEQMLKMGIKGMTGNKLFLHHILVLDTKEKMFGLTAPF